MLLHGCGMITIREAAAARDKRRAAEPERENGHNHNNMNSANPIGTTTPNRIAAMTRTRSLIYQAFVPAFFRTYVS
jgi:hypothetical protein